MPAVILSVGVKTSTMGLAAAGEILAIPELFEKHLFSLIDLSDLQVAGSPTFNSEFVWHQPFLLLSRNPVFLDYHAMHRICKLRKMAGLLDKNPDKCKLFTYAKELGWRKRDVSQSKNTEDSRLNGIFSSKSRI